MNVTRYASCSDFAGLGALWPELAPDRPTVRHEWLESWWRHYGQSSRAGPDGSDRELYLLAVRDADRRLVGVAPWFLEPARFERRVIRFLGSGEVCSDDLTLLCRPGWDGQVAETVALWLMDQAARPGRGQRPEPDNRWDLLELTGVAACDATMAHLACAFRAQAAIVDERPGINCWRLELPDNWDDYLARISKSHRKRVRRLERTYFDTGRARLITVEDDAGFDRGFSILCELHARRWQAQGKRGVFADGRFKAFHREAARRLRAAGRLRLRRIELDGRPVAAEYQLVGGGVVYAYQSGMDPAASEHQPGNLSALANVKQAIQEGFRAYDFMRGDEPYKAHWGAEVCPSVELRVRPRRARCMVRHAVWLAGRGARRWSRQFAGAPLRFAKD